MTHAPSAINVALAFCMGTDIEGISNSAQPMAKIFFNSFGQKGALAVWAIIVIVQYMMGSSMVSVHVSRSYGLTDVGHRYSRRRDKRSHLPATVRCPARDGCTG